ncbi:uncharacterized protein LOC117108385 [Anneissia japonica]|uniref:uncharacterized protein LOC117108385 n=1 Tax=Anneissia japonica TaxID=1529436 RepID=UPI0014256F06|nr:uncharacterized protein LOC117108385 [Anneissia japonica]
MPRHGDQSTYYGLNSAEPIPSPYGICSDQQFWFVAHRLQEDWRSLAVVLGVPQRDIAIIAKSHATVVDQTFAMLQSWRWRAMKWRPADEAAAQLIGALAEVGKRSLAEHVEQQFKMTQNLP